MEGADTFACKYHYPEDYDAVYVNGAIGRLNASGETVIHFFHERAPLPRRQRVSFDEEGVAKVASTPNDLEVSSLRLIKAGIIVNRDQLQGFRNMIDRLLAEIDAGDLPSDPL